MRLMKQIFSFCLENNNARVEMCAQQIDCTIEVTPIIIDILKFSIFFFGYFIIYRQFDHFPLDLYVMLGAA